MVSRDSYQEALGQEERLGSILWQQRRLMGGNNYLYEQEVGHDADGEAMTAYIESGDLEMAEGEYLNVHEQDNS